MNFLKVILLSCVSLIFSIEVVIAQAADPIDYQNKSNQSIQSGTSTIVLNIGIGFPSGEYADAETGGGAKSGLGIGVEFNYNVTESFYVGALYRNQSNPVDEVAMRNVLSSSMPPGIGVVSVSVDNWKLNSYLFGGGTISELNNDNIKFYTKMMLGLCSANSPSIQSTITDGNSQLSINQLSAEANNFAALFGLGFRIHAGESVDLLISGDYFTSNLEFKDVMISAQGQGTDNVGSFKQSVDIMSLSFGLLFKL